MNGSEINKLTIYAPLGILGYGFPKRSLEYASKMKPDVIAVDAGSTDPGPYYLGAGQSFTSHTMVTRDLTYILKASLELKCPLIIGTAGGAGGRPHLDWFIKIFQNVVKTIGKRVKIAIISAEQDKKYLKIALDNNLIENFEMGRAATYEDIDRSTHIVAQMGIEPIIESLKEKVDVVIAGRAYDAALMAAVPIMLGFDKGLAYHMGKIIECGSLIAVPRESDGAIATITENNFTIEPADPLKTTTADLVAAHTLYEKSNPVHLKLPGGQLNLEKSSFKSLNERKVQVEGSRFEPSTYKVKLEGSAFIGFRTVCIAGIRDPIEIKYIDELLENVKKKVKRDLCETYQQNDYDIYFHLYGKNAVMGAREYDYLNPKEIGLVIEVVAKTQQIADTVCALSRSATMHMQYTSRKATAGNLAFLFSPSEFSAPNAYEFSIYHLMKINDPLEPFPITYKEFGK